MPSGRKGFQLLVVAGGKNQPETDHRDKKQDDELQSNHKIGTLAAFIDADIGQCGDQYNDDKSRQVDDKFNTGKFRCIRINRSATGLWASRADS